MTQALYMILSGVAVGIFSGVFGIGGGIVLVPILVIVLGYPQHMANGTSLVALLLPVGALGVWEYYRAGKISDENIRLGLLVATGVFLGTYFGSKLAIAIPEKLLTKIFSIFLITVAIKMWFSRT